MLLDRGLLEETNEAMRARIAELEAALHQQRTVSAQLARARAEAEAELERLRHSYRHALEQMQLMRRRMFTAKAERKDVSAEQLAFDGILGELKRLEEAIEATEAAARVALEQAGGPARPDRPRPKPKGRRNLEETDLPTVRVEILDPEHEGKADRIGFEESSRLGYERGGMRRVVLARAIYRVVVPSTDVTRADGTTDMTALTKADASEGVRLVTAPLPKEMFRRGLLAPSLVAKILSEKYVKGVPFYRLEESFAHRGVTVDRGTMCRYAEDAGATLGAIVLSMRDDALAHAFCLSTDATGIAIQPRPIAEGAKRQRQPCRKGHFFVTLADLDHVFFEYQPRHTSAAVCEMFAGYDGYVQADAHAVYNALFRGPPGTEATTGPPIEVGCWSHCRRKWWEAAVCKHRLGVEGLTRIDAIFAADRKLADMEPRERHALRHEHVLPLVDSFFEWVQAVYAQSQERGLIATAAGYAVRQKEPLRRFLDDGRLRMENNSAERALRRIAAARKSWMFFGSDDHAHAAANLFSLIASCKLHGIDPDAYLEEVIRVMPYWPRERYLELSPKHWARTRARLDAAQLALPLGTITVPDPSSEEQRPSN